ncbi:MAG: FAD-dependent oxidoreductase [Flavobacteriia bacterium]|nr:FAD-dependent oxidoreductase [Flavobacteriia bacterium]
MIEYKKPNTKEEFKKNFKEKKPLMNKTEALVESSKCLFCYDPPCMKACPTKIDIPLFIKQIHTGNVYGAAQTIYKSNWLGNACAVVCPTGVLCEGSCVYTKEDILPVQIGRLQHFATQYIIGNRLKTFEQGFDIQKKVAIIGAGPAGIACACELKTIGYKVDIFETKSAPSGLISHGIAPYKISNEDALFEVEFLKNQLNFNIFYNEKINSKQQIMDLESKYDAIFIGVGIGSTANLNISGENLNNVIGAVEWIEKLRKQEHQTTIGENVIVLGGGNTAMDAATESAKLGAKNVVLAYRGSKEDMKAYPFEYELAVSCGVDGLFYAQPIEILGKEKVEGVRFKNTLNQEEFIINCDFLIKATGQAKHLELFSLIDNLTIDDRKKIKVNQDTFQTTNPKYFAGGDAVNGGSEVVNAAFEGKMAGIGIHNFLKNK